MVFDYHLTDIKKAANWVLQHWEGNNVVAIFAPMGAGKTTLTAALLEAMGSSQHAASPTFSIINEYDLPNGKTMYHMDWYRLKSSDEAIEAGVEDALYSGKICVVEWPEKAPELLPENTLKITITITGTESRQLKLLKEQ